MLNDITNSTAAPPIFENLFLILVSSATIHKIIRASAFLARSTEDGKQWWNDNSIVHTDDAGHSYRYFVGEIAARKRGRDKRK